MNVFLSGTSARRSFEELDRQRLGKQRVELKQILIALETGGAWSNHPATKMWEGSLGYVAKLGVTCCLAWKARGYKDSLLPYFTRKCEEHAATQAPPAWLDAARIAGDCEFFQDVRANLVRKMPKHYGPLWPSTSPKEGYTWPAAKK